jgi:uncharacterized protein YlxW (UPF0749 family)
MSEPAREPRDLPEHVTMPLLTLITTRAFDEDYTEVAAQRRTEPAPEQPGGSGRHTRAAVVLVLFGILIAVAAVQTSRNASVQDAGRASLITQIGERRAALSQLQERLARLRTQNVSGQNRLTSVQADAQQTQGRAERLAARTGFGAVTGPGLRITVSDPPNADLTEIVRDSDLAILVDGLWTAGAEAISINGQRLTALSAIRNVGPAIHVNDQPLDAPYVLSVVGNPDTLEADLLDTSSGQIWYSLYQGLGFGYDVQHVDDLALPAAPLRSLRAVRPATTSAGQSATEEGS